MHEAIGRSQTVTCALDPARAVALHATLALPGPPPSPGDALPPFWHQIYFWQVLTPAQLGRDGHPKTGGFIPDLGLPRRMWAGGRLEFHAPLRIGTAAEKTTSIEAITPKDGRTGPLAFVTLRHDIHQSGIHCLTEWHDLVYRQNPDASAATPAAPTAPVDEETNEDHSFGATLLFRYSALTMNGHRIHYDRDYARGVEGYDGLVVHGPLLAQYLMQMAKRQLGALNSFSFRAVAPVMDFETASFCMKGSALWVRGPDGRLCMKAQAA